MKIDLKKRNTTTSIFIPWTPDGELLDKVEEREQSLSQTCDWTVKLQERSGTPLINMLLIDFPIVSGCPKAPMCTICDGKSGTSCLRKNLVYEAECMICSKNDTDHLQEEDGVQGCIDIEAKSGVDVDLNGELACEDEGEIMIVCPIDQIGRGGENIMCPIDQIDRGGMIKSKTSGQSERKRTPSQVYIGETSRVMRLRMEEHLNKAKRLERDSFIINHWFKAHSEMETPPNFSFKLVRSFREAFGRQIFEAIMILEKGNLNSKFEYGLNKICRLDNSETEWDTAEEQRRLWEERRDYNRKLLSFIVLKKSNNNKIDSTTYRNTSSSTNPEHCCRYTEPINTSRKRSLASSGPKFEHKYSKLRKMDSSTPIHHTATRTERVDPELESPILSIAPGSRLGEGDSTVRDITTNESTESELYQMPEEGVVLVKKKTNLSNELLSTKIGSSTNNNDSSREFAVGADSLQWAATANGILDETGAHVERGEALDNALENDPIGEVDINLWNSGSSFSNPNNNTEGENQSIAMDSIGETEEGANADAEENSVMNSKAASREESCQGDQIGCPIDQIGRGGGLNYSPREGEREQSENVDVFLTPKRRLSPDDLTPIGRQRKLTTSMEASPKLRGILTLHQQENEHTQMCMAPDLIEGVGRLQLRNVGARDHPLSANSDEIQRPQLNIVDRLVRVAGRQRTLSVGRRVGRTNSRPNNGVRSISLEGQKRIDSIFSPRAKNLAKDKFLVDDNMSDSPA